MKLIKMSPIDYFSEHQRLIKILRSGGKKARLAEAKSQIMEVKKVKPSFKVI